MTLTPAAVVALVALVVRLLDPSPITSPAATTRASDARAVEVARIRAHFDSVLSELPAHDVTRLSAAQRAHRAALLTTLRAYRDAGAFPHNSDVPGRPITFFVDRRTGVHCAVAHLLASTGREDIVARVAASDNTVLVADLAADTAFVRWLDTHGLTLAEAARIQVPYMFEPSADVSSSNRTTSFTVGSALAVGSSVATSLWTVGGGADGHRAVRSIAGFVASAASLGIGVAALRDPSAPRAAAPLSLVAGGVSAWISTHGLLRHRAWRSAQRTARERSRLGSTSLSPILPVAGVSGTGVAMRITF